MRQIVKAYTPLDDDLVYFGTGFTGAGPFTATVSAVTDGLAHQVSLKSTADVHTITITITGTDADGKTQTEAITAPTSNTVYGSKYFASVVSFTASATLGSNTLDVGIKDVSVSPTIPFDWHKVPFNVGIGVDISGTINFSLQHTFEELYQEGLNNASILPAQGTWYAHSSIASKTADSDGNYAAPVRACRLLVNSLTSGATIELSLLQG